MLLTSITIVCVMVGGSNGGPPPVPPRGSYHGLRPVSEIEKIPQDVDSMTSLSEEFSDPRETGVYYDRLPGMRSWQSVDSLNQEQEQGASGGALDGGSSIRQHFFGTSSEEEETKRSFLKKFKSWFGRKKERESNKRDSSDSDGKLGTKPKYYDRPSISMPVQPHPEAEVADRLSPISEEDDEWVTDRLSPISDKDEDSASSRSGAESEEESDDENDELMMTAMGIKPIERKHDEDEDLQSEDEELLKRMMTATGIKPIEPKQQYSKRTGVAGGGGDYGLTRQMGIETPYYDRTNTAAHSSVYPDVKIRHSHNFDDETTDDEDDDLEMQPQWSRSSSGSWIPGSEK